MAHKHVLVLEIAFKSNLEDVEREIERIKRYMGLRVHWPVGHGRRSFKLVIITTEKPEAFSERMNPSLGKIDAVYNSWCSMAPQVVYPLHGSIDPFHSRVAEAWRMVRAMNYPEYLQNA